MDIRIENLCIAYGNQRVIDTLNLNIPPGCFFTLLGPSGCGKTTLLRTLAGFIPVTSGRVMFGGKDVTHLPAHQRNIGMVFQDYALFPNRSVQDNVAYGLHARKVPSAKIKAQVASALDRVGLADYASRLPAELSGGQRQRVALARALVIQPQVLLMDEPLSNLDAKLRLHVRQTIAQLQREAGITTVFVTHDQEEALALSDQIAVMEHGRVAQLGSPRDIYGQPASGYVADFIGAANLLPVHCVAPASGPVQLSLDGHAVSAHAPAPLTGKAVLVARPEDIRLSPQPDAGVPARILAEQYLGIKMHYCVELPSGRQVNVDVHGEHAVPLLRGAQVGLMFDAHKTLVLAS